MKLDRNINPDRRGKYALINLRTNKVEWGGEYQFFVIKYADKFAGPALRAYALAVKAEVAALFGRALAGLPPRIINPTPNEIQAFRDEMRKKAEELTEFAEEIENEAKNAEALTDKKLPD